MLKMMMGLRLKKKGFKKIVFFAPGERISVFGNNISCYMRKISQLLIELIAVFDEIFGDTMPKFATNPDIEQQTM